MPSRLARPIKARHPSAGRSDWSRDPGFTIWRFSPKEKDFSNIPRFYRPSARDRRPERITSSPHDIVFIRKYKHYSNPTCFSSRLTYHPNLVTPTWFSPAAKPRVHPAKKTSKYLLSPLAEACIETAASARRLSSNGARARAPPRRTQSDTTLHHPRAGSETPSRFPKI